MAVYHGRNTQLLMQKETTFRTAPATPSAIRLKYSELEIADGADYLDDPTVTGATALARKRDLREEGWKASGKSILCLNDIGFWLSLLWGPPTTTGTGPYTHNFTLDLSERPTALIDLAYNSGTLVRRWLGAALNSMKWSITGDEQSFDWELIPAVEVRPRPTAVWDASPTEYAKARACSAKGQVSDGSNTIGRVSEADIEIVNDFESHNLADGADGFGVHILGQPAISGKITAVFGDDTSLLAYMEGHTSVDLSLTSATADGSASLTVNLPAVELGKQKHSVKTSKGMMIEADWRAHDTTTAPTITLVNGVASYA